MVSRIVPFLSVVLLLVAGSALSALNPSEEKSAQKNEHRIRNIVLVHGAWADGSGWKGIYDILVKDGFNVSMVQEPETSFKEDVAATKRVLALHDGRRQQLFPHAPQQVLRRVEALRGAICRRPNRPHATGG